MEYSTILKLPYDSCVPIATLKLRGPAIAIPASVRSEIQEKLKNYLAQGRLPLSPDPEKVRRNLAFFESLIVDGEGRLWVERFVAGQVKFDAKGQTSGARRMEVFSASGDLVGELKLPLSLRTPHDESPIAIRNGRLYGIAVDSDDIPYLVCFRIVMPGR